MKTNLELIKLKFLYGLLILATGQLNNCLINCKYIIRREQLFQFQLKLPFVSNISNRFPHLAFTNFKSLWPCLKRVVNTVMTHDILVGTDPLTADSKYQCLACNRCYKYKQGLVEHQRYECGKEPAFQCPFCPYKAKKRNNLKAHTVMKHAELMFL